MSITLHRAMFMKSRVLDRPVDILYNARLPFSNFGVNFVCYKDPAEPTQQRQLKAN